MTAQLEVYDDVAEMLANMAPEKVVALKASPARQARLEELLEKNRENGGLTEAEKVEIEKMLMLNRVITLAKIRARKLLANEGEDSSNP